jgi:hypothetical protein
MNYKKVINRDILSIIFLGSLILLWPLPYIPYVCDFTAISNIIMNFAKGKVKKNQSLFFLLFSVTFIAVISFDIQNILYPLRWSVYLINAYLIYSNISKAKLYNVLLSLQILTLPIGIIYVEYLKIVDPINLHLLGSMMFSGSKNHYSFFIIINYIFISYYGTQLEKKNLIITLISIIQLIMARSATGIIIFTIIYILLNIIGSKNLKKKFKINLYILALVSAIYMIGTKIEFINYNFNERIIRTFQRIMMLGSDASYNIRTEILFKAFNQELLSRNLKETLLGNGDFVNFVSGSPFDNSYYAILVGGGLVLSIIVFMILLKNLLSNKNITYLSIFVTNALFFMTANVFFELQNTITIILLIAPSVIFQNQRNVKARLDEITEVNNEHV